MVDVTGKKFNGSLILFPYTSVVLMPDPEPTKPTAHPDHQDQSLVISITSPTKNNSYTAPATLIVEVLVNDPDNSVHSITLYNGNILLGESSFSPFLFTLKDLEEGNYTLYAVANYKSKASETSTPLKFLVSSSIEKKDSQLKVYPNPTMAGFTLTI